MEKDNRATNEEELELIFSSPDGTWEDFTVVKVVSAWGNAYDLGFEFYVGHTDMDDAVEYFHMFLREWQQYLKENNLVEKAKEYGGNNSFYRSYGIEVAYEHDCYFIGVNTVRLYDIGEIEEYLVGVIEELEHIRDSVNNFDELYESSTGLVH